MPRPPTCTPTSPISKTKGIRNPLVLGSQEKSPCHITELTGLCSLHLERLVELKKEGGAFKMAPWPVLSGWDGGFGTDKREVRCLERESPLWVHIRK